MNYCSWSYVFHDFERGFLAYCNHILSLTAGCQREEYCIVFQSFKKFSPRSGVHEFYNLCSPFFTDATGIYSVWFVFNKKLKIFKIFWYRTSDRLRYLKFKVYKPYKQPLVTSKWSVNEVLNQGLSIQCCLVRE